MRAIRRTTRGVRNIPSRIFELDNMLLLLVGIGIGLFIWFGAPQAIPEFSTQVDCRKLGHPRGGNSRSLLALAGDDQQQLTLEVRLNTRELELGDSLEVSVIFQNKDAGPVILYVPENEIVQRNENPQFGVVIEFVDPFAQQPPRFMGYPSTLTYPNSFDDNNLFILHSNEECAVRTTIDPADLDILRGPVGEYLVGAYYRNNRAGIPSALPAGVLPTATPLFNDQGVWDGGQVESEQVRFRIVTPPPPTLPPVQ